MSNFKHSDAVDIVAREMQRYNLEIHMANKRGTSFDLETVLANGFVIKAKVRLVTPASKYTYIRQSNFDITDEHMFIIALYMKSTTVFEIYLLPATQWGKRATAFLTKNFDKPEYVSKPEYGINFSEITLEKISSFKMASMLNTLTNSNNSSCQKFS